MNYYQKLKPRLLDIVKTNVHQFTDYDKTALEHYKGEFILGANEEGTDLFLLSSNQYDEALAYDIQSDLESSFHDLFETGNKYFFHGKEGEISELDKDQSEMIALEYIHSVLKIFPMKSDSSPFKNSNDGL